MTAMPTLSPSYARVRETERADEEVLDRRVGFAES